MPSAETANGMPTVTVSACDSPASKASDSMDANGHDQASPDPTDWQSVVREMLSVTLPTKPIATRAPPKISPFGAAHSLSHRTLASYAMTSAEQEALGSGSPKASRSPLATTPRTNSGLLLVRIEESQVLDTSSDCGDVQQDPNDPTLDPDYFRQAAPREQQRTRSRLAQDSGRSSRASSAGDQPLVPEQEQEPLQIDPASLVNKSNLSVKTSTATAGPDSSVPSQKSKRSLSLQTVGMRPSESGASTTGAKGSLAKYKPDAAAVAGLSSAVQGRGAAHGRKMRRSVVARMSEHGGDSEDEGERVDFAEERLTLDGLKRNIESKLQIK